MNAGLARFRDLKSICVVQFQRKGSQVPRGASRGAFILEKLVAQGYACHRHERSIAGHATAPLGHGAEAL